MNLSLKDRNALVCGSTQGIGKAVAQELALLGANVTLIARNETRLMEAKSQLDTSQAQEHSYIVADFSSPEMLKNAIENYLNHNKKHIHILVNNTGGPPAGKAIDANTDDFLSAFNLHLISNQILVQAVINGMKNACYGRIINIISTSVKQPLKNLGVSNTIRGAVASWAKTLSVELAPFGITVNNVLPGATQTGRLEAILENKATKTNISLEDATAEMLAEIPAGRFAQASEIANAVAFLASESAGYINGVNLPVDGGRLGCL